MQNKRLTRKVKWRMMRHHYDQRFMYALKCAIKPWEDKR